MLDPENRLTRGGMIFLIFFLGEGDRGRRYNTIHKSILSLFLSHIILRMYSMYTYIFCVCMYVYMYIYCIYTYICIYPTYLN